MGSGASAQGSDALPDMVDEMTAQRYLGQCFDRADWETISNGTGQVDKQTFVTTIDLRNHAPSLRAWLEFWRLDELTELLEYHDVMSPTDLGLLDQKIIEKLELKTVQKKHWQKAMAHSRYLETIQFDKPPSPLQLWLESWRLGRLLPGFIALGCDVKEDLIDLEDNDCAPLNMRMLELKRWAQGKDQLLHMIRNFDFNDATRSSVPTMTTWLYSLKLEELAEPLELMGCYELADLADIDDRELASLGLNRLQLKHWNMGLLQVMAASKEAMADGQNDLASFSGWLESWRLGRLKKTLDDMGAYTQQDLLDLEESEYHLLGLKPLEMKRFMMAMPALREEFDSGYKTTE